MGMNEPTSIVMFVFLTKPMPNQTVNNNLSLSNFRTFQPADSAEPILNPSHSPASWRRQPPSSDSNVLGSVYERASKTAGASSSRGDLWSSRGQGSGSRAEGRSGAGSRLWNRQSEHH